MMCRQRSFSQVLLRKSQKAISTQANLTLSGIVELVALRVMAVTVCFPDLRRCSVKTLLVCPYGLELFQNYCKILKSMVRHTCTNNSQVLNDIDKAWDLVLSVLRSIVLRCKRSSR
ncbi:Uncharacterized protein HZ326_28049 [Fusarium oxysporum f. sp. albedinis]|nr:Uncharacterized protein HZ326_28049 [Fusarium oxysporum f. sp. albedinis]